MSVEVEKIVEQNTALLSFLAGTWATRFTASESGVFANGLQGRTCFGSVKVRGLLQLLPDGGVAGHYMPIENPAGADESTTDCLFQLRLDPSDNALVAYLGDDKSVPGIKGVWSKSGLLFRGGFHDSFTMWDAFQSIRPQQVTARPSTVSITLCQASESSWLLDVAFMVQQPCTWQATPVGRRCRLEFWHFRERPDGSTRPHPQDVEESFDEVLRSCDDVSQDIESRIDEIDDLIASLEDNRTKCEEHLRLLGELESNAENGKDEADSLGDAVQDMIIELHDKVLVSAEGFSGTGEVKDILADTLSKLDGLQADAESLETEIDFIEADVDFPADLIGSIWTNAEYARAKQLLRENQHHLPPPNLSFLGPLKDSLSKLSEAATRIVNTTAVLVQAALRGELPEELDYGPQIASMAKVCERILDDVFRDNKEAIERDLVVRSLVLDERSWQYRIPPSMSKVTSGDLTNVVKLVKKSIENKTTIKWNGMGNKRFALLLFGGWIPVYQATCEHVLNPLGVNNSEEYVQTLPNRLSEFQNVRNGFVHHDLAETDDLQSTWICFQDCLKGLLQAFYSGKE